MIRTLLLVTFFIGIPSLFAQSKIKGKIIDLSGQNPLEASIKDAKGNVLGNSNEQGDFEIEKPSLKEKIRVVFNDDVFEVDYNNEDFWTIKIDLKVEKIDAVNIKQNRLKEKLKESPLTVESMSAQSIKETPASDFYEALGHLKGVDVTAASLGFRIVNTRGFNSTSPVRTLQIIDGVDNQSPGLNFSLGNFLGASELDVANQEIIVGASSAFYGPGAFNGVISITTKDPWKTPGLSVKTKVGERGLSEYSLRYAHVFKNKQKREFLAMKFNAFYMQAYDWVADNAAPATDSKQGISNLGGYDAVNKYGDEILRAGENDKTNRGGQYSVPGLGMYYREGYWEKDLVDYNTYNVKTSFMASWKPNKNNNSEIQYQVNLGMGTTVYQGDNRYSLRNIKFMQNRLEWKQKNGFIRAYATNEDAGQTYDAVFTAQLMQNYAKRDDLWAGDLYSIWLNTYAKKVKGLSGYPNENLINPFDANPAIRDSFYRMAQKTIQNNQDQMTKWFAEARALANRWCDFKGLNFAQQPFTYDRYQPGTERFDSLKNAITNRKSFGEGGSGFFDKSGLYHIQGERRWNKDKPLNFVTGFSSRLYNPNTAGTIFCDTNGRKIINYEGGVFGGTEYRFNENKWKVNLTARVDKNVNFPVIFSPAASIVYTPDKITFLRLSLTSGVRNPTLADQYLYYNVGRAILLGNLNGYDSLVTIGSVYDALGGAQPDLNKLQWFNVNPVKPERVKSIEIGYKSFLFKNKLNVDASAYYNVYTDFIGYKIGYDPIIGFGTILGGQGYRIATNAESQVSTMGVSAGFYYFFGQVYTFGANYSYNKLNKQENQDPIIPAFNTPENKFNLSFGCNNVSIKLPQFLKVKGNKSKYWGYNINYKWIQGFMYEGSPQFTGYIPTYWMLDAMISKEIPIYHTSLKIGASNITNNMNYQVYGGPRIGRLAYISLLFNIN